MKFTAAITILAVACCVAEETTNQRLVHNEDALTGAASKLYGRSPGYVGHQGAGFPYPNNLDYGNGYGNSLYGGYYNSFRAAPFRPSQLLSVSYDYPSYSFGGYKAVPFTSYANINSFGYYLPYAAATVYGAAGSYGSYGIQRPVFHYPGLPEHRTRPYGLSAGYY